MDMEELKNRILELPKECRERLFYEVRVMGWGKGQTEGAGIMQAPIGQ
jgi:hypothetical protein